MRSFDSLTYCHVSVSKKRKFKYVLQDVFSARLPKECCRLSRVFPDETQERLRIGRDIYQDCYESSYLPKVKKWLHTFNESCNQGDLAVYANDDQDSASQLTKYDIDSKKHVCSDVEMVSDESSLNEADRNVWTDMVSSREAINATELKSTDRRTWDDIL